MKILDFCVYYIHVISYMYESRAHERTSQEQTNESRAHERTSQEHTSERVKSERVKSTRANE